jgi:hypothetical protein
MNQIVFSGAAYFFATIYGVYSRSTDNPGYSFKTKNEAGLLAVHN